MSNQQQRFLRYGWAEPQMIMNGGMGRYGSAMGLMVMVTTSIMMSIGSMGAIALPSADSPSHPELATPDRPELSTPDTDDVGDRPTQFGTRGQDRWYFHGSVGTTLDNDPARRFGMMGAGVSHFFINGHSINLELNGFAFNQTGEDAVGLNLNALMRWHFVRQENWSLYVDGGAGLLGTTSAVPNAGSQFNFTPQVGGGATVRLHDDQRLMMGVRWHHISNADLYSPNPGRDSIQGYVGLDLPR